MKKNYLFIIAAAFAALAISCSKELEGPATQEPVTADPEEITGEFTCFTATVDAAKSALGTPITGGYKVDWNKWNDGEKDVVDTVVVNGKKASDIEIKDGGRTIDFKVADVAAPYFAVVASANKDSKTGLYGSFDAGTKSMNVLVKGPANPQKYVEDTYDPEGIIMAAYSEKELSLNFKHYSTFLQLTVDSNTHENKNIQWVYIRDGEGNYLAGSWKFDFSNPNAITLTPYNMTKPIAYYCGEEGIPVGTPMTIALPAYNYDKGLIITIKDVDGQFSSFKVDAADYSGKAGVIMTKTFTLDPKSGVINNEEDWKSFVKMLAKSEYDIYKFVGNGTVKIGNDITFETSPTRITGTDDAGLIYNVDGQKHTFIFNCDRNYSLVRGLKATIKDLTIKATDGHKIVNLNPEKGCEASSFVDTLYASGQIINCVNEMPIELSSVNRPAVAGGIVKSDFGGYIENCVNKGDITVTAETQGKTVANNVIDVGGIAAVFGTFPSKHLGENDMTIKDCRNEGSINITPVSKETGDLHANGFIVFGVGGIVGWIRDANEYVKTLDNCDNAGAINLSGNGITSINGLYALSVSVGGIVGIASNISLSGTDKGGGCLSTPDGKNGIKSVLKDCDNSGNIYNGVTNYSGSSAFNSKVYTAGVVGSLMGNSDCYAVVDNCTNIGDIMTYDVCGTGASTRAQFCCVPSGLVGWCGYADIKNCTVCCRIGNGKRAVVAIAGLSPTVFCPVKVNNCNVYFEGYFARMTGYKYNRSLVLNVPAFYNSTACAPAVNVSGSEMKGCKLSWELHTSSNTITSATDVSDQTSSYDTNFAYKSVYNICGNNKSNQLYDPSTDFTRSGNKEWTDHPEPGHLPEAN